MNLVKSLPKADLSLRGDSVGIHKKARSFYNNSQKNWNLSKFSKADNSVIACDSDVITIDSDIDDDSIVIDSDQDRQTTSNSSTKLNVRGNLKPLAVPEDNTNKSIAATIFVSRKTVKKKLKTCRLLLEVNKDPQSVSSDGPISNGRLFSTSINPAVPVPLPVIEIDSDSSSSLENSVQVSSSENSFTPNFAKRKHSARSRTTASSRLEEHLNCLDLEQSELNLRDNRHVQNLKLPSNFQLVFSDFCGKKNRLCQHEERLKLNASVNSGCKDGGELCVQQNSDSPEPSTASCSWHTPVSSNLSVLKESSHSDLPYNSPKSGRAFEILPKRTYTPNSNSSVSKRSSVNGLPSINASTLNDLSLMKNGTTREKATKRVFCRSVRNKGKERQCDANKMAKVAIQNEKLKNDSKYKNKKGNIKVSEKERAKKKIKNKVTDGVIVHHGERPMAMALMDLGRKLVSKEVVSGLIKNAKTVLDSDLENKEILLKYHTELKHDLQPFQLGCKICLCGRFKSESRNILLTHQGRGASFGIYRCCFCTMVTTVYQTFYQHMTKKHYIRAYRLPKRQKYCCSLCFYETSIFVRFQSHQRLCVFREDRNLYPHLVDFDIPVRYNDEHDKLLAKKLFETAELRKKTRIPCHMKANFKKSVEHKLGRKAKVCKSCGKSFFDNNSLSLHIESSHHCKISKTTQLDLKTHYCNRTNRLKKPQVFKTTERILKCCFCKKLLGKDILKHLHVEHHISLHTMVKKLYCYLCELSLSDCCTLESHMLLSHSELFLTYKHLWKKVLSSFKNWRQVVSLKYDSNHGDVNKPWRCVHCDKHFMAPSIGYRHISLIHAVGKVECEVCGKMVSSGATYIEHIQQYHIAPCSVALSRISKLPKCI